MKLTLSYRTISYWLRSAFLKQHPDEPLSAAQRSERATALREAEMIVGAVADAAVVYHGPPKRCERCEGKGKVLKLVPAMPVPLWDVVTCPQCLGEVFPFPPGQEDESKAPLGFEIKEGNSWRCWVRGPEWNDQRRANLRGWMIRVAELAVRHEAQTVKIRIVGGDDVPVVAPIEGDGMEELGELQPMLLELLGICREHFAACPFEVRQALVAIDRARTEGR